MRVRTPCSANAECPSKLRAKRTIKYASELVRDIEAVLADRVLIRHVDGGCLAGTRKVSLVESTNETRLEVSARQIPTAALDIFYTGRGQLPRITLIR